jgi:hypothetical protein
MPRFYTDDIDVEVDDFMEECSKLEIKKVIQWLKDCDYITDNDVIHENNTSPLDCEYMSMISKLNDPLVGVRLDNEDLEILKKITDKI